MDPDPERPEDPATFAVVRLSSGREVNSARVHALEPDEFDATISSSPVPVLVDFHAEWCAPCRWLDPVLTELADSSRGRFLIAKVDTDRAPEAARTHRIASVPTVILFQDGREIRRSIGVEPERLREWLDVHPSAAERTGS